MTTGDVVARVVQLRGEEVMIADTTNVSVPMTSASFGHR
jgi:hypothetical protein